MTKRIYPSQINDPHDTDELYRMLKSWDDHDSPPNDVRIIKLLWDVANDAVEQLENANNQLDDMYAGLARAVQEEQNRRQRLSRIYMNDAPDVEVIISQTAIERWWERNRKTNGPCNGHVEPNAKSITGKAAQ